MPLLGGTRGHRRRGGFVYLIAGVWFLATSTPSSAQISYGGPSISNPGSPGAIGAPSISIPGAPGTVGPAILGTGTPSIPGPPAPAPGEAPEGAPATIPAWLVVPSIQIDETYNDNVNLAPKGQAQTDFITAISPALTLTGQTPRLSVNLSYAPQELIFARGSSPDTFRERLLGAGRAELLRELLFFEAGASIDQQFVSSAGPIGPTTLTSSSNLQTIEAVSASPYVLNHLGPYANSETRYRFSNISLSGNTIAPEQIQEGLQRFSSGEYFGRLTWTLTGDFSRLARLAGTADPLTGTSSTDRLVRADAVYPVYQALSIVGGVGYERITDPTLTIPANGIIWNAGVQYKPNEFTAARVTYGKRFGETDVEADLAYTPTPALLARASYSLSVQTSQSQISNNLALIGANPSGAGTGTGTNPPGTQPTTPPAPPPTAQPSNFSVAAFGINSGTFLVKQGQLQANLTSGRNTFSIIAYESEQSGNVTVTGSERAIGGIFGWGRQIWPDLTLSALAGYYHASFPGTSRADNSFTISLGLDYTLSRTTVAHLSLSRFDNESNVGANTLVNDLAMVSIRKQF